MGLVSVGERKSHGPIDQVATSVFGPAVPTRRYSQRSCGGRSWSWPLCARSADVVCCSRWMKATLPHACFARDVDFARRIVPNGECRATLVRGFAQHAPAAGDVDSFAELTRLK